MGLIPVPDRRESYLLKRPVVYLTDIALNYVTKAEEHPYTCINPNVRSLGVVNHQGTTRGVKIGTSKDQVFRPMRRTCPIASLRPRMECTYSILDPNVPPFKGHVLSLTCVEWEMLRS